SGLEAVWGNAVLLHGYAEAGLPVKRGLEAWRGGGRAPEWVSEEGRLRGVLAEGLWCEVEGRQVLLDRESGEMEALAPARVSALQEKVEALAAAEAAVTVVPALYAITDEDVQDFVAALPEKPFQQIAIAVHGRYDCISWHTRAEIGTFQHEILVLQDGAEWLRCSLESDMNGMNPDAFLIYRDQLFLIRNQTELHIFDLASA
ncbi:MAG: hypothetical protein AAF570_06900, partial [Bacteroidota bacterium]